MGLFTAAREIVPKKVARISEERKRMGNINRLKKKALKIKTMTVPATVVRADIMIRLRSSARCSIKVLGSSLTMVGPPLLEKNLYMPMLPHLSQDRKIDRSHP